MSSTQGHACYRADAEPRLLDCGKSERTGCVLVSSCRGLWEEGLWGAASSR